MDERADEIRRLQGCINDLISLLALRAVWEGRDAREVARMLLDVLVGMLGLDFAYLRLGGAQGALEVARAKSGRNAGPDGPALGRTLGPWLAPGMPAASGGVPNPLGAGELTLTPLWLGLDPDAGVLVAGSARPGFPSDTDTLLLRVALNQAALELHERNHEQLRAENLFLRDEIEAERGFEEVIGRSPALLDTLRLVEQVAPTDACVLILGETGTGKELIANAIHRLSPRQARPFVKLNCAAIPTGLLESELFGHEKGAFTGALSQRVGRFDAANQGTLFLDEVGEIPLELQAKLLRVLQEQEFERLGSDRTHRVDVRVIAASNRELAEMVEQHEFRSDLYYRLNVFPITVPPVRERIDDIPLLFRYFAARYATRFGRLVAKIPPDTLDALRSYPWPGNVREIENLAERSVILSHGDVLEVPLNELRKEREAVPETGTLEAMDRAHVLRALDAANWVLAGPTGAAARLGVKRTSLQHKMKRLGITRPRA
jgi:transcriptional regulator with GAF, ATPase, and Fis domain